MYVLFWESPYISTIIIIIIIIIIYPYFAMYMEI